LTMRRFLLLLAPCALWGQATHQLVVGQPGPVMNKPFSGVETRHMTQVLGDGTRVDRSDTSNFYRDSAGRMRTESATRILIYDSVAKVIYDLDPKHKIFTRKANDQNSISIAVMDGGTYVHSSSDPSLPAPRVTGAGRPVTEELPRQFLNGIAVKGSRVTSTIPAGAFGNDREIKVVTERWFSDDLQVLVKSTNSDPRFGTTTYDLSNIVVGPPNPAMFQVPGEYREGGH
jgi:hypothetical protein